MSEGQSGGAPGTDAPRGSEVLRALGALSAGIDGYRHAIASRLGIGLPEVIALAQLGYTGPVRAGAVQDRTGLSAGAVTALLDRLEGRGFLTRSRPPTNRRTVEVALTAHGRDVVASMFAPVSPLLDDVVNAPDIDTDLDTLVRCLDRVAALLTNLAADQTPP